MECNPLNNRCAHTKHRNWGCMQDFSAFSESKTTSKTLATGETGIVSVRTPRVPDEPFRGFLQNRTVAGTQARHRCCVTD